MHHNTGSPCSAHDYEPHVTPLGPKAAMRITTSGGRPTNSDLPYFNIEWPGGGAIVVLGWPGQWAADFKRDEATGLQVRGGQELTHFKLLPGEEVRSPLVVVQFWKGDRLRAQNVWRRWMLAHNLPRPGGKPMPPISVMCTCDFYPGMKSNAADEIKYVRRLPERRRQVRLLVDGRRLVSLRRRRLEQGRHLGARDRAAFRRVCGKWPTMPTRKA